MASSINITDENFEQFAAILNGLSADYRDKPEVRTQLDEDPREFFASRGVAMQADTELRVVANTADVFHLALPPNPNAALQDDSLEAVAGGQTPHSSISTFPSTVSSVSSYEDSPGRRFDGT